MTDSIQGIVYHYCSIDSFHAIVASATFRLSNVFFMNDHMEVEWFKQVVRDVADELGAEVPSEFRNELDEWFLSHTRLDHVYCGCFSAVRDDLSQWRGYANDGCGVAIGVDLNSVCIANPDVGMAIERVEYDKAEQRQAAQHALRSNLATGADSDISAAFTYLSVRDLAPNFKNPAFEAEKEIRLVAKTSGASSSPEFALFGAPMPPGLGEIKFAPRQGRLVPFVEIEFPRDAIKDLWVGPKFGGKADEDAVQLFLAMNGIRLKLSRSLASYR